MLGTSHSQSPNRGKEREWRGDIFQRILTLNHAESKTHIHTRTHTQLRIWLFLFPFL